jgi:hypothetical protein
MSIHDMIIQYIIWHESIVIHGMTSGQYMTVQYNKYDTVQYTPIPYNTVKYSTKQYNKIKYKTAQYSTVQYHTAQYSTVIYNTVPYSTIQNSQI